MSCLKKETNPGNFLKNWRPITLLNVLYKMISGCISNRLKYIRDSIISDTQSGFIKGRYNGENTRFIYDLMYYIESHNIPGLLHVMLIDFEISYCNVAFSHYGQ